MKRNSVLYFVNKSRQICRRDFPLLNISKIYSYFVFLKQVITDPFSQIGQCILIPYAESNISFSVSCKKLHYTFLKTLIKGNGRDIYALQTCPSRLISSFQSTDTLYEMNGKLLNNETIGIPVGEDGPQWAITLKCIHFTLFLFHIYT